MSSRWYLRWWAWIVYALVFFWIISGIDSTSAPVVTPAPQPSASILASTSTPAPATPASKSQPTGLYSVTKVVDGDTITVDLDGKATTLRLIGINTPETVDPRKPVECFGKEASDKAKTLFSGKQVRLEADPTQGELDKYQRLLRYVFLPDGTNFNKLMIEQGYAYEYTYNIPYKYQVEFKQAEQEARAAKRGLWADNACGAAAVSSASTATPTTPKPVPAPTSTAPDGKYICSRNAYNCSDFKTQAEAQAAFNACGGTANDVHQLDRDKDGRVCESLK
jgi:micrococcal nuclease